MSISSALSDVSVGNTGSLQAQSSTGAGPGPASISADDEDLATLEQLSETVAELKAIVAHKTKQAHVQTAMTVRQYPFTAVLLAGGAGALIGLALTRRSPSRRSYVSRAMAAVPSYEAIQRSIPSYQSLEAPTMNSLSRRFEHLVDQISGIDPNSIGQPAIDAAKDLYGMFRSAMNSIAK